MNGVIVEKALSRAVSTEPVAPPPALPGFLNRELSWLEFNRRVLHEAIDRRTPLLERVRFLGIFNSNLDEFYMKRVGGLKRQLAAGIRSRTADGWSLVDQLVAIRKTVLEMVAQQAEVFTGVIRPELEHEGIFLCDWMDLDESEREEAFRYFHSHVFPVLTPLSVDPGHPFPFISNLSTSLGFLLRHPKGGEELFARLKVPKVFPQWIRLTAHASEQYRFISLQQMIRHNAKELFPQMTVQAVMPFRITRNAEVERDEADADDLLEMIEAELRQRRFAEVVRLEHGREANPSLLRLLMEEMDLRDEDVYAMPAELDYTDLTPIAQLDRPKLRYEPWVPVQPLPSDHPQRDIFSVIRSGDRLVHHPYDSFSGSVERFIAAAAADPKVLAIKMTVYRTGDDSPFAKFLIRAANAGKQVVCLVELKARFDEERNIHWAQLLEKAGVHVVYGIVGLKTHTKTALVVRQESDGLRCYAHIGSGNYNTQTSKVYTDLGLFTCDPVLTHDLIELFNYLTGRSLRKEYKKLIVAPVNMKTRFLELIEQEANRARAGEPAHIIAKTNSLEDRDICHALYAASHAGVSVDLIVRGFCCLRPGVPVWSERIRVVSVIGRFLEHSRLFYFRNGAVDPVNGAFYIGSADWMYRNMLSRVEAVIPIESHPLRERCWEVLQILLNDQRQGWDLRPDGSYAQRVPEPEAKGPERAGTHQALMDLARKRTARTRSAPVRIGGQNPAAAGS